MRDTAGRYGLTSICYFFQGAKTGGAIDFADRPGMNPHAVGGPCTDGIGAERSLGIFITAASLQGLPLPPPSLPAASMVVFLSNLITAFPGALAGAAAGGIIGAITGIVALFSRRFILRQAPKKKARLKRR
jgi:hypothetical protein